jgi:hypothetical protein
MASHRGDAIVVISDGKENSNEIKNGVVLIDGECYNPRRWILACSAKDHGGVQRSPKMV